MAESEDISNIGEADIERSSEVIRQDIAKGEENISDTVDQISDRIKEKLDWREYVKESPYLAIGSAAGLGYIVSGMFITRTTPLERIMGSVAEEVRSSLGGRLAGIIRPNLIKVTLEAIALKVVSGWIKNAISTTVASGNAGERQKKGCGSSIHPMSDM